MKGPLERTWISPAVTVAFAVVGVTGLLLFFHIKNGPIMTLHEWFGWGFVIIAAIHLLLNWRQLLAYVKHRSARLAITFSFLVLAALTALGAMKQPHGGGRPAQMPVIVAAMDANRDGTLGKDELKNALPALMSLDQNGDGELNADELQPRGFGHR